MTVFWDVVPRTQIMTDVLSISETSVNMYHTTRHNMTEDTHILPLVSIEFTVQYSLSLTRSTLQICVLCKIKSLNELGNNHENILP
jgi:hypothetical protein